MAKIKVKKVPGGGMGDKPEQGTPSHEKKLENQIKGKWKR
jgi:hypothetical protein